MSMKQSAPSVWRLDIRVWRDGVEYRRREDFEGGKKAAEVRCHEIKKALASRAKSEKGSLTLTTFGDALRYYLDRNEVGTKTMPLFNRLVADLGAVRFAELAERFDRWLLLLRQSKSARTGRPISNGTHNRYLAYTKAVCNFAVKHRLIEHNPVSHISGLKEVARDVSISEEDERRLLNVIEAEAPHIGPAVRFMLQVPCRKSEVVNMRRTDLDLFSNCIRVRNGTTKNDAGIDKPIPPDMVPYMRSIPAESEFIFYRQQNGRYLPLGDFKRSWNRCMRLAGLAGLRGHDLRHVAATRLVDNGTPEQVVMTVAGWKTNMLRTYYNRNPKRALELVRFKSETGLLTGHLAQTGG